MQPRLAVQSQILHLPRAGTPVPMLRKSVQRVASHARRALGTLNLGRIGLVLGLLLSRAEEFTSAATADASLAFSEWRLLYENDPLRLVPSVNNRRFWTVQCGRRDRAECATFCSRNAQPSGPCVLYTAGQRNECCIRNRLRGWPGRSAILGLSATSTGFAWRRCAGVKKRTRPVSEEIQGCLYESVALYQ